MITAPSVPSRAPAARLRSVLRSFAGALACTMVAGPNGVHAAAPANPPAPEKKSDTTGLSIFEVKEDKDEGYRTSRTTSGFNSLTFIRATPASISVLNREYYRALALGSGAWGEPRDFRLTVRTDY